MEVMFYCTMCLTFLQSKTIAFNHVSNLYLHTRCIKHAWWFLKFENPLRGASIQTIITYSDDEKEHWSVQHRIAAVELHIKTESVRVIQHGFWQQFLKCDAPSRNTLVLWTSKWLHEGSVKDYNLNGHSSSAHTPDNGPCLWKCGTV